jgi:hypothetical protein
MKPKIEKLIKAVPPLKEPKDTGNEKAWEQIKKLAALPDWLFPFFHTYGSGVFAGFDKDGGYHGFLRVENVFKKPYLKWHKAMGEAFSQSNQISKKPYAFFPDKPDGLFPILGTDQAMFLLIDPSDESKVYTSDNHVHFFREIHHNYVDYLILLFKGKERDLWAIPPEATIHHAGFFSSERDPALRSRA